MSVENRKRMYDLLIEKDELFKDDGALIKEFGLPPKKKKKQEHETK